MNRAPAFQFYPNDWLSSPTIALMSPAEEGAYIRLLSYAWADPDCSLPDDDAALSQLSRLGEGWFNGGSTTIRKCFKEHPEKSGRLVNIRLLEERKKQDAWREKSRIGGLQSGKSRTLSGRVVQPPLNQRAAGWLKQMPTLHLHLHLHLLKKKRRELVRLRLHQPAPPQSERFNYRMRSSWQPSARIRLTAISTSIASLERWTPGC
jgi:uncharacterized protein YdaU (DUF1376 family)